MINEIKNFEFAQEKHHIIVELMNNLINYLKTFSENDTPKFKVATPLSSFAMKWLLLMQKSGRFMQWIN